MKKCIKCGLPEHYQGIILNKNQVCNYCEFYETHKDVFSDYKALEKTFEDEIEKAKKKAAETGAKYDCITGLSGGKDGAYITYQLQHKYGLRVLTYTLDNGFSTEFGRKNIEILLDKLDVEHIWVNVKDSTLRQFYSASMRLIKNFCSVCFHFCHYYSHLLASQYGIPLIVNGRTRSQILQSADSMKGIEPFEISRDLKSFEYQMFKRLIDKLENNSCIDFMPDHEITSLSYFMYHDISDDEKIKFLEENLGWMKPKSSVPHADCWAHPVAEYYSIVKHGYPVRTGELAEMVREGKMQLSQAEKECREDWNMYQVLEPEIEERFMRRICIKNRLECQG
ncbi:MAG: hypothetical protein HFI70_02005 [Lachnospiraceae bacterium]|nr:hypothetical protein [Lachnospiraceae bacterium]